MPAGYADGRKPLIAPLTGSIWRVKKLIGSLLAFFIVVPDGVSVRLRIVTNQVLAAERLVEPSCWKRNDAYL